MTELRKYLDEAGELPRDVLLGNIVIYTIHDGQYELDMIKKWFAELDLDESHLPFPTKPVDAYKKSLKENDDHVYELKNGNVAHVLIRDVVSDKEMIVRHLIREVRDSRRRRLEHEKVGEAVFYRPTMIRGNPVPGSHNYRVKPWLTDNHPEYKAVKELCEQIRAGITRHEEYLDGMKARHMVREYIKHLSGIELKPSVYFIPVSRSDELARLTTLVSYLVGNDNRQCTLQRVPLVDLEEQRTMIVENYQKEAIASLQELVAEISEVGQMRRVTPEAFSRLRKKYDTIRSRTQEYRDTLRLASDNTDGAADMAGAALKQLAESMMFGADQ